MNPKKTQLQIKLNVIHFSFNFHTQSRVVRGAKQKIPQAQLENSNTEQYIWVIKSQ